MKARESALDRTLWRVVARFSRLTPWKRIVIIVAWTVVVTTAVYLWVSTFDCPFC